MMTEEHEVILNQKRVLEKECEDLRSEVDSIKSQLSEHAFKEVQEKASKFTKEVFTRLDKKLKAEDTRAAYSGDLRVFSITLHGYSAKAYRYVKRLHGSVHLKCEKYFTQ